MRTRPMLLYSQGNWYMDSSINCLAGDHLDYAKYPELKEEMKSFNKKVKEVISVFDGSLCLAIRSR